MPADHDLIQRAASGSTEAHLGLVEFAIEAGSSGACRQIESLAAAETWARLAAAGGGQEENWALVNVMLSRAKFEAGRGLIYNAHWYDGEARRILALLVAVDDERARRFLDEMGPPTGGDHHAPDDLVTTNLFAAARGDLTALGSLCDEALRLLREGQSDPIEALTVGELYARMTSVSGDVDHVRRLAGILLKRAEYEYSDGWPALADNAVAEAAVLLSILVDTGDDAMAAWLDLLVESSRMSALVTAARHRPAILKFFEPQGTC